MSNEVIVGLLLLAVAAFAVTLVLAWQTRQFLARAVRTEGTVVRVDMETHTSQSYGADHPADTTECYRPVVAFLLEDGSSLEFRSRAAAYNKPMYRQGEVITVAYDRAAPSTTAEIEGAAVWRRVVASGLATFALGGLAALGKACG